MYGCEAYKTRSNASHHEIPDWCQMFPEFRGKIVFKFSRDSFGKRSLITHFVSDGKHRCYFLIVWRVVLINYGSLFPVQNQAVVLHSF